MKYIKKLLLICCAVALSLPALSNEIVMTDTSYAISSQGRSSDSGASPQSDNIGWRYKTVNGKKYMRLYNYSTKQWIGDWILVP